MADENETKIRDAVGPNGTESPAESPADVRDTSTSVYVIECAGFVKIGVAKNPLERLAAINTGTPVVATLFGRREFAGRLIAYNVESQLHRTFRHARANGEWFAVPPETAMAALNACRVRKVRDANARHDSLDRWDFSDDDPTITDLLTSRLST